MLPNLFAIDDATSIDTAAMMLVVKKREPNSPGSRLNLSWKINVTQDLYIVSLQFCGGLGGFVP